MPSVRSYFNLTLYRKHLARFWPLWTAWSIIWFFMLPVNLILSYGTGASVASSGALNFVNRTILQLLPKFGVVIAAFYGVLSAMAVWSYLYGNRPASLMHALPIRREGLFFTGFAAGVTFFLVPNTIIFLLTLGAENLVGAVNLGALGLWFAMQTMFCLFFFCFATFCAFVTGHILALPSFFLIFNFLTVGLLSLIEGVLHQFVYGFDGLTDAWSVADWLSPLYNITSVVNITFERENGVITNIILNGVSEMVIYSAVGLLLVALALVFYRRHKVEQAGEVVTATWLRPVFKYGVAFCGSLAFGSLFYAIFDNMLRESILGMLFFLLLFGFLSYLAAEMLLQKSFRVLKKSWKGCVVFLLAVTALTAAMELDLTGYERRVPDPARVEQVELFSFNYQPYDSGSNRTIMANDAALIGRIVSLHESTVRNKTAVEDGLLDLYQDNYESSDDASIEDTINSVHFSLNYILTDGRMLTRSYTIPVTDALLDDPASPASLLEDILNNRPNRAADFFPPDLTESDLLSGSVMFRRGNEDSERVDLTAEEAKVLYAAALQDLNAGQLGRRYLLQNMEYYTQVYMNEITLTFLTRDEDYAQEYGYSRYAPGVEYATDSKLYGMDYTFYPQTDSVNVIAALRELGVLNERHTLITMLDARRMDLQLKY